MENNNYIKNNKPNINLSSDICQMCNKEKTIFHKYALCHPCQSSVRYSGVLDNFERTQDHKYLSWLGRLTKKYGHKILDDFESLKNNPYTSLEWVGKEHGLTRERIRQLYYKIYGEKYTIAKREQSLKKSEELSCKKDVRNYFAIIELEGIEPAQYKIYEKMFIDECLSRGFDVPTRCESDIDFIVNGFDVDVKFSKTPKVMGVGYITKYHHYSYSKKQADGADFLACYHNTTKAFFIIPMKVILGNKLKANVFKSGNGLYISSKKSTYCAAKNRYWEYKDAWNLLENNHA